MIVIPPIEMDSTKVTSSTIAYPDSGESAWSSADVSYSLGQTVSYWATAEFPNKFQCIKAHTSSASNAPALYPNENEFWLDLGAANRFAMFQLERNTQSSAPSPLIIEITPDDRVGAIGFGNMDADYVQVQVYNGAELVFDETKQLLDRAVANWYEYFYSPIRQVQNTLFLDLPILATARIKITLTKDAGNVKVGFIVMGMPFNLGATEYKATARALNFSDISRDEFGEAKLTKRRSIPETTQTVLVDKEDVDQVGVILNELNAQVALWSGLSNPLDGYFNSLFVIGIYKDTEFNFDYPEYTLLNIKLEGI